MKEGDRVVFLPIKREVTLRFVGRAECSANLDPADYWTTDRGDTITRVAGLRSQFAPLGDGP